VVVQPAETQSQVETLTRRVGDLEETLRRLNGQLDQLAADITASRRDAAGTVSAVQAANGQNAQIAGRLDALERRLADMTRQQAEAQAADPVLNFSRAMQLYTDGKYPAAATALQTFVDNFSTAADAPEARYYLGESFFRQADYADAATAYINAIRGWPQTPWAPDAVVKLSVSLIELKKSADACGILSEFSTRYPRAPAAVKTQASSARSRAKCS
jgi:tol-pal system protein YbgF